MSITTWPTREKLLQAGAQTLSDAELIAVLIKNGIPERNAIELAHDWLMHYGSLHGLFAADYACLSQQHGMDKPTYCQLKAAMELHRRYLQESLKRQGKLLHVNDAKKFLRAELCHHENETFACLFLDSQHRIIHFEKLFSGSINQTNVHPRVVVKRALYYNSAALIAAHNHPSGIVKPSQADRRITQHLQNTLPLVEIRLLDHIIVGDQTTFSFAEAGLL